MMKHFARSCTTSLQCQLRRTRKFGVMKDITGSTIRSAAPSIADSLDESIVNILSSNQDCRPKLAEILSIDPEFHFAKVLHSFENARYQLQNGCGKNFTDLEALLSEGSNKFHYTKEMKSLKSICLIMTSRQAFPEGRSVCCSIARMARW